MITIPAPTSTQSREEWPDADFDLPEGQFLHEADKDEDWDLEMSLGQTGGAKVQAVVAGLTARRASSTIMFNIRPPPPVPDEVDDDDEGVSTIKVSALPKPTSATAPQQPSIDEDIESAFSLPSDLTQLSLRPMSLSHRSSKNSLEWGDKDYTYSSQSSDAYSTLGFTDASPSSNSTSSASSINSLPDTDDDDDEGELEGLVIPSNLFKSGKDLHKILERKKRTPLVGEHVKIASPDDDFEIGLEIDDDVDLSPSRLLQPKATFAAAVRSSSMPLRPSSLRPPSRKADRAKSPTNPPVSSQSQFQKLRLSPSPPLRPINPTRAQTFQALSSAPPASPTTSFLSPKPGSLRGQKSHSILTGPSPPPTLRKVARKASLSSLESSNGQASGSGQKFMRYEEPTAASRAKSAKMSASRVQDYKVPPARPTTPSSNAAAVRLTMPTVLRHNKSRPALSSVFSITPGLSPSQPSMIPRSSSPLPPRPSSKASIRSGTRTPSNPQPAAPKVLRRPKRQKMYGDGTELDTFDDLPTDRDKESQFRVQPKAIGNRVPGGTYSSKTVEKGTIRRKKQETTSGIPELPLTPATNTLKRAGRIEFPSKIAPDTQSKRKLPHSPVSSSHSKRKPTLIRNLGGNNAAKVVGDMKWNPTALRWEGNDTVLRDFDAAVGTSTRPALITHLTGSSMGSPVGSFASGARKVGNMIFDPTRMCWISTLPPDEEEPDVFANLADDEDDDSAWESKGDTIRAFTRLSCPADNNQLPEAPSPAGSHTRTLSESGSERGSRASLIVCDIDEAFMDACRAAAERHRSELKGWQSSLSRQTGDLFGEPDRSYLHEIRALATRRY